MDDMLLEDDYLALASLASLESCCRAAAEAKPRPKEAPTRPSAASMNKAPARDAAGAAHAVSVKR